ncbi:MAG: AtpZ/AtpI family protein [Patescibacteria group bacterium]
MIQSSRGNASQRKSLERFDLILTDASKEAQTIKKEKQIFKNNSDTWFYLGAVGDIGFTIAIPIVLGGIVGTYIDTNFGTKPAGVLVFLFLGIVISLIGFIYRIKDIIEMQPTKK